MSWSDFNFDIYTPQVYTKLTANTSTSKLQYKKGPVTPYGNPDCLSGGGDCDPPTQDYCGGGNKNYDGIQVGNAISLPLPTIYSWYGNRSCRTNRGVNFCSRWQGSLCGEIDGDQTCSIAGIGASHNSVFGIDWGTTCDDPSKVPCWDTPYQGWQYCKYNYDYTNFNKTKFEDLAINWLARLSTGVGKTATSGMDKGYMKRIADTNFVYSLVLDFYNQVYSTGFYSTTEGKGINDFLGAKLNGKGFADYINDFRNSTVPYFLAAPYDSSGPSPDLVESMGKVLSFPSISQDGDIYTVTLHLSYRQYQDYMNTSDKDRFISGYMDAILRDSQGTMGNIAGEGTSWTPKGVNLVNSTVVSYTAVQVVDNKNVSTYSTKYNIKPADFKLPDYNGYILATVDIQANVDVWSPMLVVYSQIIYPSLTFSENVCKNISSQCGYKSANSSTIPLSCLNVACDPSTDDHLNKCKANLSTFCLYDYTNPPPYVQGGGITMDQYLVRNNSDKCLCYTSGLARKSAGGNYGNTTAMCFDKHCDSFMRNLYNIQDGDCAKECNTVWDWLNNPDNAGQSQNVSSVDLNRLASICGQDYRPYMPYKYNLSVLSIGVMITLFSILLIFSVGKSRKTSQGAIVSGSVTTFIVLGGITAFATLDLAGVNNCEGKNNPVCRSKITKVKIPQEFCNYTIDCECQFDQDCRGGCKCVSGSCLPATGHRKTKVIEVAEPRKIIIGLGVFLAVVIPLILISLNKGKPVYIVFSLLSGILPLVATIVYATAKRKKIVFAEPCSCGTGPCGDKVCGEDACGNSCGTCKNGEYCYEGKCKTVSS